MAMISATDVIIAQLNDLVAIKDADLKRNAAQVQTRTQIHSQTTTFEMITMSTMIIMEINVLCYSNSHKMIVAQLRRFVKQISSSRL